MRYKVNDIGDDGIEVVEPVEPAWLCAQCPDIEAAVGEEGLALRGRLERSGHEFLLRGELRGGLVAPCGRCLETARVEVDQDLLVSYVPGRVGATAARVGKGSGRAAMGSEGGPDISGRDDDLDAVPFSGDIIDIGPEIRDHVLLALPMSPLCREDCAGLCAVCGGNRNRAACDCEERQRRATSKLAGLAALKS